MSFMSVFGPRVGMKMILIAQLVLAALLVISDVSGDSIFEFHQKVVPPVGPVTPGDQRREYRVDRPVPELIRLDRPVKLTMPKEFGPRLTFVEHVVDDYGTVLLVSGKISNGDAIRFKNHIATFDEKPDLVTLHSPGGLVSEALDIGRQIRRADLSTAVLAGGFCVSSCPYMLAGGVNRLVSIRGIVGMHQHYYEHPKFLPIGFAVKDIQISQGKTLKFLIEMDISPSLMVYSLNTPPEQIYALVQEELSETKIALEIVE